jgi:hypothetical protein
MQIPPRLRPTKTPALEALGLEPELEERFAYYVERALADPRATTPQLRRATEEIALTLWVGGAAGDAVVRTVEDVVLAQARDCGRTTTSVVSGRPRAAALARRLAKWAAVRCAPDHPYLRTRRQRRRHGEQPAPAR